MNCIRALHWMYSVPISFLLALQPIGGQEKVRKMDPPLTKNTSMLVQFGSPSHWNMAHPHAQPMSPDGQMIAIADIRDHICIHGTADGSLVRRIEMASQVCEFSPDGMLISGFDKESNLCVWDVSKGRLLWRHLTDFSDLISRRIHFAIFSHDSKRLYTGTLEHALVFNAQSGELIGRFRTSNDRPPPCSPLSSFSTDSNQVIGLLGKDKFQWNLRTGHVQWTPIPHMDDFSTGVAISLDGSLSAMWRGEKVLICQLTDMKILAEFPRAIIDTCRPTFSPDGKRFAFSNLKVIQGDHWFAISEYDLTTKKRTREYIGNNVGPRFITYSRNGRYLGAASALTPRIWDTSNGMLTSACSGSEIIQKIHFSPDDTQILSVGRDGTRIWHSTTGKLIEFLPRQYAVGWLDNGPNLALFKHDGHLVIRNMRTNKSQDYPGMTAQIRDINALPADGHLFDNPQKTISDNAFHLANFQVCSTTRSGHEIYCLAHKKLWLYNIKNRSVEVIAGYSPIKDHILGGLPMRMIDASLNIHSLQRRGARPLMVETPRDPSLPRRKVILSGFPVFNMSAYSVETWKGHDERILVADVDPRRTVFRAMLEMEELDETRPRMSRTNEMRFFNHIYDVENETHILAIDYHRGESRLLARISHPADAYSEVMNTAVSDNGSRLAVAVVDKLYVFDTKSFKHINFRRGHTGVITAVSFSHDNKRIAVASNGAVWVHTIKGF